MLASEMAHIEPQMRPGRRVDAASVTDARHHVPRHDVAARKFLLLRLGVDHEAVEILVQQVAAIAAAALGDENAAG